MILSEKSTTFRDHALSDMARGRVGLVGRHGFGLPKQMALPGIAAEPDQPAQHLLGVNTLGRGLQAERLRETQDCLDDLLILRLLQHLADEGAVDLDGVDLQRPQMVQARIAGTEIAESYAYAQIAQ